jgi:hypothetical protein
MKIKGWMISIFFTISIIFSLLVSIGIIYVAIHFITKYW